MPGAAPPVLVAALGPRMLEVAGSLAGGVITTWALEPTLGSYLVPTLSAAASAAGRPDPEVVAGICVSVTADAEGARQWVNERFSRAADIPAYRAVLDREGAQTMGDVTLAGDEETVARALTRLRDAGATALQVVPVGTDTDQARTTRALPRLAPGG